MRGASRAAARAAYMHDLVAGGDRVRRARRAPRTDEDAPLGERLGVRTQPTEKQRPPCVRSRQTIDHHARLHDRSLGGWQPLDDAAIAVDAQRCRRS